MFDESKYYLGGLCKNGHCYMGARKSLRYRCDSHCVACIVDKRISVEGRAKNRLYSKVYYNRNRIKEIARSKKYHSKHKESRAERQKDYRKLGSIGLSDTFVRDTLCKHSGLRVRDISPEFIELKRIQMKAYRASQAYRKGELTCQTTSQ